MSCMPPKLTCMAAVERAFRLPATLVEASISPFTLCSGGLYFCCPGTYTPPPSCPPPSTPLLSQHLCSSTCCCCLFDQVPNTLFRQCALLAGVDVTYEKQDLTQGTTFRAVHTCPQGRTFLQECTNEPLQRTYCLLQLVNFGEDAQRVDLQILGLQNSPDTMTVTLLNSTHALDENSFDDPFKAGSCTPACCMQLQL